MNQGASEGIHVAAMAMAATRCEASAGVMNESEASTRDGQRIMSRYKGSVGGTNEHKVSMGITKQI